MLFAAERGYLDDVELEKITAFETALLAFASAEHGDLMAEINAKADYNDDIVARLSVITSYSIHYTKLYDRNRLANEVSDQLKQHFGDKVYRTIIPRNVRLAEAPSFGAPAMYYDKSSLGAKAYLALAGEILRREEQSYNFV